MTTTIKMTVTAEKNMFGKRSGAYVASLGPWTARGTTKDKAATILNERLVALERYERVRRYLHAPDGTVFVLWHTFGGWEYDMSGADRKWASSCCLGVDCRTEEQAFAAMRKHWEQYCEQGAMATK